MLYSGCESRGVINTQTFLNKDILVHDLQFLEKKYFSYDFCWKMLQAVGNMTGKYILLQKINNNCTTIFKDTSLFRCALYAFFNVTMHDLFIELKIVIYLKFFVRCCVA